MVILTNGNPGFLDESLESGWGYMGEVIVGAFTEVKGVGGWGWVVGMHSEGGAWRKAACEILLRDGYG